MAQERLLGAFVVRLLLVAGRLEIATVDLRSGTVERWRNPANAWQRLLRDATGGPTARREPENPHADPDR